ncbi:MAG: hypothetical protein SCH71_16400 [Desulfobulbaceae bacterium]|nr:hypothetical protein [Desulfobulbaceae bacterium]
MAAFISAFFYFDLGRFLTLQNLKVNQQALVDYYQRNTLLTIGIFLAVYMVQTAFSLPGAAIMSLAAGALFGLLWGTVLVNIGATGKFFHHHHAGHNSGYIVYVNAGSSLATIDKLSDVTSFRVLGSFALLGLFALIPVFYIKLKKKKNNSDWHLTCINV